MARMKKTKQLFGHHSILGNEYNQFRHIILTIYQSPKGQLQYFIKR